MLDQSPDLALSRVRRQASRVTRRGALFAIFGVGLAVLTSGCNQSGASAETEPVATAKPMRGPAEYTTIAPWELPPIGELAGDKVLAAGSVDTTINDGIPRELLNPLIAYPIGELGAFLRSQVTAAIDSRARRRASDTERGYVALSRRSLMEVTPGANGFSARAIGTESLLVARFLPENSQGDVVVKSVRGDDEDELYASVEFLTRPARRYIEGDLPMVIGTHETGGADPQVLLAQALPNAKDPQWIDQALVGNYRIGRGRVLSYKASQNGSVKIEIRKN